VSALEKVSWLGPSVLLAGGTRRGRLAGLGCSPSALYGLQLYPPLPEPGPRLDARSSPPILRVARCSGPVTGPMCSRPARCTPEAAKPDGQRRAGVRVASDAARSHRNEGSGPVEPWAISRKLDHDDATKSTTSRTPRQRPGSTGSEAGPDHSRAFRRIETRCRVTPKRSAICSIVRPSA
jgi:hypothetical protein